MKQWWCCLTLLVLVGCQLPGATLPSEEVFRNLDWWKFWYNQADIRMGMYFCAPDWSDESVAKYRQPGKSCDRDPDMVPLEVYMSRVKLIEQYPDGRTCTNTGSGNGPYKLKIPADKWDTGCQAHEMQHTMLRMIGDPCAHQVEHRSSNDPPGQRPLYRYSSCRS